jgi:hypothetical protein
VRSISRLLDLAGMSDTLVADGDGVYHPGLFNDRLLLGMKGIMSEALCRTRHSASYTEAGIMPSVRPSVAGPVAWWAVRLRSLGCGRHNQRLSRKAMMASVGW